MVLQYLFLDQLFQVFLFHKASQKLYISQPAISLQIQKLEKKLDVSLFERNKQQVEFTETGQLLLRYGNRILSLCEETFHGLQDLQDLNSGTLIIGASQTTGTYLLPRIVGLFRQHYPHIKVQLQVHSTRRIAWSVANGQIELGIVGGEIPQELETMLEITPYARDEFALILPKTHPLAQCVEIKKEDLYSLNFITLERSSTIRKVIDKSLKENGIDSSRFNIEMELSSIEAIKNAVQAGLGAAFVSVSSISKELKLDLVHWVNIENLMITRVLSIITNPTRYRSKASESFSQEMINLFLSLSSKPEQF